MHALIKTHFTPQSNTCPRKVCLHVRNMLCTRWLLERKVEIIEESEPCNTEVSCCAKDPRWTQSDAEKSSAAMCYQCLSWSSSDAGALALPRGEYFCKN